VRILADPALEQRELFNHRKQRDQLYEALDNHVHCDRVQAMSQNELEGRERLVIGDRRSPDLADQ
jgi:hypothetical protein